MAKSLSFTKDDILNALINSMSDNTIKSAIVKNLLDAKIDRLDDELKFEEYFYNSEYGSSRQAEEEWDSFDGKKRKKHNNKVKKISSLIKQKTEYIGIYNELIETSFSDANMTSFKSKIKQVFKWEEKGKFNDLFNNSTYRY
ncbi:MAG: hypothetical protein COB67_02480 [SAR324 cluster bacterium]|uniref:Uncharacterized protein n=1 Tax=SAR324 cluster bacterium TaxID=2024889 RepID=A0A2A4T9Z4_9DELT|nr:MAG: hypothetical protein COB67_02480 [SAR324 cluster bacterium]